jgi:acetyl-CoA carboxylase carboxyl transferase subunit beta
MAWFEKPKYVVKKTLHTNTNEGLWRKCASCNSIIYNKEWEENLHVCTHCGYHDKLNGIERIQILIDAGTFVETNSNLISDDPLQFHDGDISYSDKIRKQMENTKLNEAVITGYGKLNSRMVDIAVMDFAFLGGSMGSVVGEKITLTIESAIQNRRPLIIVSASGGARMHEGILSLMQMAKTSAALKRLSQGGGLYISVLTDPTSGGVTASFAMLGDVNIAEKNALIGFAGARVIEGTMRQKLPAGFQRAEFLLEHGFVDIIAERKDLKNIISAIINYTME